MKTSCCVLRVAYCVLISALYMILNTQYPVHAQVISSSELINNAREYDGQKVVYSGEVVGDVMVRGAHAWVNVNDTRQAIGIWTEASLALQLNHGGSYRVRGDWIEAEGVFHRACSEHGGDLDIHAQAIRRINSGGKIPEKTNPDKIITAGALFIVVSALVVLNSLRKRKS